MSPQFASYEMNELEKVLRQAESDYVILDHRLGRQGIIEVPLGREEYVVIESARFDSPSDVYLDHDSADTATADFFSAQKATSKPKRRAYMGDVYGIITGVELGLGRAVMSRHLIADNRRVRVVKGFKSYSREVVLHFFEQPYYSRLHHEVVTALKDGFSL